MEVNNHEYFKNKIEITLRAYNNNSTTLVSYRHNKINEIYNYYLEKGFPKALTEEKMSLIPFHFQEAIYDGIYWEEQNADLHQMEISFELDCIFQNEGKMRCELSEDEFRRYITYSDKIIKKATRR